MSDEGRMSAEDVARAAETLRELLRQVDAGEVDAGTVSRAHVAGTLAALDQLLTEDHT